MRRNLAPGDTMAFEGDLSNLALGDVLQTLAMSRQVGTFVVRAAEERRLAFSVQGVAVLSYRPSLGVREANWLVGTGRITPEDVEHAVKVQRRRREESLGDVLLSNGACTADDLRAARRYLAAEEIYELFYMKEGRFEFLQGEPDRTAPLANLWFDVGSIAMEAARRIDELPRCREAAPPTEVLVHCDDQHRRLEDFDNDEKLKRIYDLADGTRTVQDVVDDSHLGPFDTWKALFTLVVERSLLRPGTKEEVLEAARTVAAARDLPRAARLLFRAAAHDPADDGIRQRIAETLTQAGERRAAAEQYVELARSRLDSGRNLPAVEALRHAIRLDNNNPEAHEHLLQALLEGGDVDGAVEAARQAASLRIAMGDHRGAAAVAEHGLAQHPGDPALLTALANAQIGLGRPDEALRILDDVAQILESTGENDRRLIDVYRKILQLEPGRRECQRRMDEILATERSKRRRIVQRVAIAAGVLVLACAAVPLLARPSATAELERARDLLTMGKLEEAQSVLDGLSGRTLEQDEEIEQRVLRGEVERALLPPEGASLRRKMSSDVDGLYREANRAVQERRISEGLSLYQAALDLLDSAEALRLRTLDAGAHEALCSESAREVHLGLASAATECQQDAAQVVAVRDRFVDDVFRKEDLAVLRELVAQSTKVTELLQRENWGAVDEIVDRLVGRTRPPADGSDRRIEEAVATILEAGGEVAAASDKALSLVRKNELKAEYVSTYTTGGQLERSGQLEEAAATYESFLDLCERFRRGEPAALYAPLIKEYFDVIKLPDLVRARLDRIRAVLQEEDAALRALAAGDVEEAFRRRSALVRNNAEIAFDDRRFRLPLRIETRPAGAHVVLLDDAEAGRLLGSAPLTTEYGLRGETRIALRLPGFREHVIVRHGAAEDASGHETIDLVKLSLWMSEPGGHTEAAPAIGDGVVVLGGRDAVLRWIDSTTGRELHSENTQLMAGFSAAPLLRRGRLHAVTLDRVGLVFDAATHAQVRRYPLDGPVCASPVSVPRGVLLAEEAGVLRLVDDDGNTVWKLTIGGKIRADLAAEGSRVVLVTSDSDVVLVDTDAGRVLRRQRLPVETFWGPPLLSAGRVVLGGDTGLVVCLGADDLQERWRVEVDGPVRGRAAPGGGGGGGGAQSGSIETIDASGTIVSRVVAGGPVASGVLALPEGFVAVTVKGIVLRFDPTGALLWRYDAGDAIVAPPRLADGRILVITRRGVAIALAP